jgi:V8-like Glu-specific endopeptidase
VGWENDFRSAARDFDWPRVVELTDGYVRDLRGSGDPAPSIQVRSILGLLRENLRYEEVLRVADAALGQGLADVALGEGVADAVVRRQYAQALVDRENPAASLLIFQSLVADPEVTDNERVEARGGVGRCYKQLFVLHRAADSRVRYLQLSLAAYRDAYQEDRRRVWHGINAVALLRRAARDGICLPDGVDAGAAAGPTAADILDVVQAQSDPDAWSIATGCEAYLALDRHDDAVEWGARFAADRDADAFKIASFLRQLVEIWQLDTTSPPGTTLLPVLRSALLERAGGNVVVETHDVRASRLDKGVDPRLEKVLGPVRYQSLRWYQTGLERCRAVARVENRNEDGIGTGFLVAGKALHEALPDTVLVTNGHVVPEALDAADAVVVFRGLDSDGGRQQFHVVRRWWYEPSDSSGLDTTVLELDAYPAAVTPVPLARRLPNLAAMDPPRAYLIGHPRGLEQPQFSLQDNLLLDYDETLLHYRSPTEGGSSGSPVFNSEWQLIGVHHAGGFDRPRLRKQGGSYAANEAISLSAIEVGIRRRPPAPDRPTTIGGPG